MAKQKDVTKEVSTRGHTGLIGPLMPGGPGMLKVFRDAPKMKHPLEPDPNRVPKPGSQPKKKK